MVVRACNSNLQEAQAGGLRVGNQPEGYSENLSRKIIKNEKNLELEGGRDDDSAGRTVTGSPKELCVVPSTHIEWFTTVCSSSSGGSQVSGFCRHVNSRGYTHMQIYM